MNSITELKTEQALFLMRKGVACHLLGTEICCTIKVINGRERFVPCNPCTAVPLLKSSGGFAVCTGSISLDRVAGGRWAVLAENATTETERSESKRSVKNE